MSETELRERAVLEVHATASELAAMLEALRSRGLEATPLPGDPLGPQAVRAIRMDAAARTARALAHEVANYLGTIRTMAFLLADEVPEGSEARADIEAVSETVEAGTRFLEAVRAFVHPEPLGEGRADLNAVVRDAEPALRDALAPAATVAVRLADGDLWVRGEAGRLRQLLLDLGRAAVAGSAGCVIETGATPGDGMVRLTARVPGREPAPDALAAFFEPFVADRGYEGGLRLPTVYAVVTASGGAVTVESAAGSGLSVHVGLREAAVGQPGEATA